MSPAAELRIEAPGREAVVVGAHSGEGGALEQCVRTAHALPAHGLGEAQGEPPLGLGRGVEGERVGEAPLAHAPRLVGQQ